MPTQENEDQSVFRFEWDGDGGPVLVTDFELYSERLDTIIKKECKKLPTYDNPWDEIVLSEQMFMSARHKECLTEILFEQYYINKLAIIPKAILATQGRGKACTKCLSVHWGRDYFAATPVVGENVGKPIWDQGKPKTVKPYGGLAMFGEAQRSTFADYDNLIDVLKNPVMLNELLSESRTKELNSHVAAALALCRADGAEIPAFVSGGMMISAFEKLGAILAPVKIANPGVKDYTTVIVQGAQTIGIAQHCVTKYDYMELGPVVAESKFCL